MTQTRFFILLFSLNISLWGQQLVQNFSNIQLQNLGSVGFQNVFFNDSGIYDNLEFIRFYNIAKIPLYQGFSVQPLIIFKRL